MDRILNVYGRRTAPLFRPSPIITDAADILQMYRANRHYLLCDAAKQSEMEVLNFLRRIGLTPVDCRANSNEILRTAILDDNCPVLEWLSNMGITIDDCINDDFAATLQTMFRRSLSSFWWFRRAGLTRAHVMPHIDSIMRAFIRAPNAFPSALKQLRELGITIDNGLRLGAFVDILRHNCSLDQVRALFDMGMTMEHLLDLRKNYINLFHIIISNGYRTTSIVHYLKNLETTSPGFNGLGHHLLAAAIFHQDFPDRFMWLTLITLEDCRANDNLIPRAVILEVYEQQRKKQIMWLAQRGVTIEDFGLSPENALKMAMMHNCLELLQQVRLPPDSLAAILSGSPLWTDSKTLVGALEWMQTNKITDLLTANAVRAIKILCFNPDCDLTNDDTCAVKWIVRHKILSRDWWLALAPIIGPFRSEILQLAFPLLWLNDYKKLCGSMGLSIWCAPQNAVLTAAQLEADRGCAKGRRLFLPPELWKRIQNFM